MLSLVSDSCASTTGGTLVAAGGNCDVCLRSSSFSADDCEDVGKSWDCDEFIVGFVVLSEADASVVATFTGEEIDAPMFILTSSEPAGAPGNSNESPRRSSFAATAFSFCTPFFPTTTCATEFTSRSGAEFIAGSGIDASRVCSSWLECLQRFH